jgi:hypothetical protein
MAGRVPAIVRPQACNIGEVQVYRFQDIATNRALEAIAVLLIRSMRNGQPLRGFRKA